MKTNYLQQMKIAAILLVCFFQFNVNAQNFDIPPQEDYLSVIKGTFEYVLFDTDTELDSLDEMDHALFRQKEIIEKETLVSNSDGRSYSETEVLWYEGFPMWREPFWKLRTEDNYTLLYSTSTTQVPDTSYHSEISLEMNAFLDSIEGSDNIGFSDYYTYTAFPDKNPKSEYVTEIEDGVFQVEIDEVVTIFNNNDKTIETIYPDYRIKEYYSRIIDDEYFLAFRVESTPIQLRNGDTAQRMMYSRFSNYTFNERESDIRSTDFITDNLMRVYPNPSAEELTIEFPKKFTEGLVKLEIFDLRGKIYHYQVNQGMKETTLILRNILQAEGVYILRLTNSEQEIRSENFFYTRF